MHAKLVSSAVSACDDDPDASEDFGTTSGSDIPGRRAATSPPTMRFHARVRLTDPLRHAQPQRSSLRTNRSPPPSCLALEIQPVRRKSQDCEALRAGRNSDFDIILSMVPVRIMPARPRSCGRAQLEHGLHSGARGPRRRCTPPCQTPARGSPWPRSRAACTSQRRLTMP